MEFGYYLDKLFAELPDTQAARHMKEKIGRSMERSRDEYLSRGMDEEEAFRQALFDFGSMQGLQAALVDNRLKQKYQRFMADYPRLLRFGFFSILILPLIFLVLMFSLESKLIFLVLWIISIIGLSTFLICVEYTHYNYQRVMEQKASGRIERITSTIMDKLARSLERENEIMEKAQLRKKKSEAAGK